MPRCPNCGSTAVTPTVSADNQECQSCGWLTDEGLGGDGFDWDAYHESREEREYRCFVCNGVLGQRRPEPRGPHGQTLTLPSCSNCGAFLEDGA